MVSRVGSDLTLREGAGCSVFPMCCQICQTGPTWTDRVLSALGADRTDTESAHLTVRVLVRSADWRRSAGGPGRGPRRIRAAACLNAARSPHAAPVLCAAATSSGSGPRLDVVAAQRGHEPGGTVTHRQLAGLGGEPDRFVRSPHGCGRVA